MISSFRIRPTANAVLLTSFLFVLVSILCDSNCCCCHAFVPNKPSSSLPQSLLPRRTAAPVQQEDSMALSTTSYRMEEGSQTPSSPTPTPSWIGRTKSVAGKKAKQVKAFAKKLNPISKLSFSKLLKRTAKLERDELIGDSKPSTLSTVTTSTSTSTTASTKPTTTTTTIVTPSITKTAPTRTAAGAAAKAVATKIVAPPATTTTTTPVTVISPTPPKVEESSNILLDQDYLSMGLPLMNKKFVEARQQPKSPAAEAQLAKKYLAIESLEERAFQILLDLGMIVESG